MSSSKVQICNMALAHLGQRDITSIDSSEVNAIKCKAFFDATRDAVLREHKWAFATTIDALALISAETIIGWDYLYAMPSGAIIVRRVLTEDTELVATPQEFREVVSPTTKVRAIATNLSDAYAEYTMTVTDTTLFDPMFVEALSYKLAAKLAQPLCGNVDLGLKMAGIYQATIAEAKRLDKCASNEDRPKTSKYIDAR